MTSEVADIRPLTLKDEENIVKLFANPSIYNQTSFTPKNILNDFADYSGIEYTMDFYYIGVFIEDLLVGGKFVKRGRRYIMPTI